MPNDRAFPLLSPFDATIPGSVDVRLSPGRWHRDDSLLERVATGTALRAVASLRAISSVPGIWAHAQNFYDLWSQPSARESENPHAGLRNNAVAAWRGLLALVGLSDTSQLPVRLQLLRANLVKPFLEAALTQCPKRLLAWRGDGVFDPAAVNCLGFVLFGDPSSATMLVAGLLTLATLVLPSREFLSRNSGTP